MYRGSFHSPIGWLNIEVTDWSVIALYFTAHPYEEHNDHPLLLSVQQQLNSYFEGGLPGFDLPVDPPGTVFQRHVWEQLQKIPMGKTITYAELARQMGDAMKVRAVASANAANPIALIIPCHRVLGSNGALTGYAWGMERKEWLLFHEQHLGQLSLF